MTRKKPISELPVSVRAQRPRLAPDVNQSNSSVDLLDAQLAWQQHIDAGLLKVR